MVTRELSTTSTGNNNHNFRWERHWTQSYFSLFRFTGEFAQQHPAGIWWILNNPDPVPQHQYHLRHSVKASMKQEALFNTRLLGVNTPFTNYSINPLFTHIMSVGSLFLENNHQHFSLEDSNTMNVELVRTWTVPVNVSNRNFRSQQMSNKLAYLHDSPWCNENNLYSKHILIVDPTNKIYLAKSFRASFGRFHRFGKSWPFWYIWSVNILSWKIQRWFNAGVLRDSLGFVTTDFIQYLRSHSSYTFYPGIIDLSEGASCEDEDLRQLQRLTRMTFHFVVGDLQTEPQCVFLELPQVGNTPWLLFSARKTDKQ